MLVGREGSVGFPGKNVFPVLGRPLMVYPLTAALNASSVDMVFVSTDSPQVKQIAMRYGARVIDRPLHLCTKEALAEDVFLHGFRVIEQSVSVDIEMMVLLFCNAPTILASTIDAGVKMLRHRPDADSVVTVSVYNMWSPLRARRIGDDGYLKPFVPFEVLGDPRTLSCDRDSQGDVYFADMGMSIVRPHCLAFLDEGLLPQRWMGKRILPLLQWGGLDVDYAWQIGQVEYWLRQHGFSETSTPYDVRKEQGE